MQNITKGQLRVLTYSQIYSFPPVGAATDKANMKAELRVVNDAFWLRLCLMSDLGFSEAFMYGDVECDDLVSLFNAGPSPVGYSAVVNARFRFFSTTERTSQIYPPRLRTCSPCPNS
jgi:hypothetical protein